MLGRVAHNRERDGFKSGFMCCSAVGSLEKGQAPWEKGAFSM